MYEVHGGNWIGRSNLDAFEVVEQQREVANAIELDPRDINDEMAIAHQWNQPAQDRRAVQRHPGVDQ